MTGCSGAAPINTLNSGEASGERAETRISPTAVSQPHHRLEIVMGEKLSQDFYSDCNTVVKISGGCLVAESWGLLCGLLPTFLR